jgi:competence protein ComEC
MKILQFPLVKIIAFFALGIVSAFYLQPIPNLVFIALGVSFIFFGLSFYFSIRKVFQKNYFAFFTILISLFLGVSTQVIHTETYKKNHFTHFIENQKKEYSIEVTLKEKLKENDFSKRFVANVRKFDANESCGKIILNIRKDSLNHDFGIGSILKIRGSVYKNKEISNPNQFDYGKYLENQQIYGQVYCDVNDIQISSEIEKSIWYYASSFRNKIIKTLQKNGFGKSELSVIIALILGQQQDISQDVLHDYQYAGAVHILSVSGLHVGFILLFINFLLRPIPKNKMGSFTKLMIVIVSLWVFGVIAGLAPSVVRSVTMFSFVAIGMHLKRSVNIYHTLLVSAFLILLFQPSFLFDVGFQLSYVSLFFIVWLQPLFSGIWKPKNRITNYFWDILTVSFAAQIGAFPLSVYYFHQFPGLFFVTNLVILPAMGLVLGLGVFVMLLAYLDYVPVIPMRILEWSIWLLNKIIAWIASLEQFIISNISFNFCMLLTMYMMLFAVFIWFKKPSFQKLSIAMITIILFQISCFSTKYFHQTEKELIVFNVKKNSILCERNGENSTIYANDSILQKIESNRLLNPYLIGNFATIHSKKKISNTLFFKNKKILIMDSLAIYPKSFSPNVVIITHSPRLNLERFLQVCKPEILVADASNFKSYVKIWKATCEQQKIPFHATAEKGFYRLK